MPSPSAPSLREDGSFAGKSTVPFDTEIFQHVAPPGSQDQPPPDGRIYGPGPRVPMLVLSPWSRGGWVNSQVFDHTSVLQFLEKRFQVHEPNISAWRRAVCGDPPRRSTLSTLTAKRCRTCPPPVATPPMACASARNSCRRYRCHRLSTSVCPTNVAWRALPARCPTSCTSRPPSRPNSAA